MPERKPEAIGPPVLGIARAALFRDFDEPQGDQFSDGRRYAVAMHSEIHKLFIGSLKIAVFSSAPMSKFNFQPMEDAVRRQTEDAVRGRLQHLD